MDQLIRTAKLLEVIHIGMCVAAFLLRTSRILKAIEIYKECLMLLNGKACDKHQEFVSEFYKAVYASMFYGYSLISDEKNMINCGTKLLALFRECGERDEEAAISLQLAALYQSQSEYEKAKELYMKALTITIETGDKDLEALAYVNLGAIFHSLSEYVKAKEYLQKALQISKEIRNKGREALCYVNLGAVFLPLGEHVKAKEYLHKALQMTKEIGDKRGEASSHGNLGAVFCSLREYVKAEEHLQKALQISKKIGDKGREAETCGTLGIMFQSLGEYVRAEEYLQRALQMRKDIGDKRGEAADYRSLGSVFTSLGAQAKAEKYFQKALQMSREIGDHDEEATCYVNLGGMFNSLGEYIKAEDYLQRAIQMKKETGDKRGEASSHGNLGAVFCSLGEYVKAEEHLHKALQISKELGAKTEEATCYGHLGTVFQSRGEYVKAETYLQRALQIRIEIGDKRGKALSFGQLGSVFHSLGEYTKAKEYVQKSLQISNEIGAKNEEARCYRLLGVVFVSLGEYVKAKDYIHKALQITKEISDKGEEALSYGTLGVVFLSLGEYVKAEEHFQRALQISKEIGAKNEETTCYENLGAVFQSRGEYVKAKEHFQRALQMRKEIGGKQAEAADYINLGYVLQSLNECFTAEECLQKALAMNKEIGQKKGEAFCYLNLGTLRFYTGEYFNAKEHYDKALATGSEIGCIELQFNSHLHLALNTLKMTGNIDEAVSSFRASIQNCEEMRGFLRGNDQFHISFSDMHALPFQFLSLLLCKSSKFHEALYVVELGRARALADMMSAQYSVEQQISVNPRSLFERTVTNESNYACLYISYFLHVLLLWVLKRNKNILFRMKNVNDCFGDKEAIRSTDEIFSDIIFRNFGVSPTEENCEDRSLFPSNAGCVTVASSCGDGDEVSRMIEEDDEDQHIDPPNLTQCYQMIIAPVADLLDEPEVIIVPDRVFYKVPFAAFKDESGKYFSESFRIRIVPSLMTLKLTQDSPAGYHSQTGALLVGEPDIGDVYYKGRLEKFCPLPGARKEVEMIGRLLGAQPLFGEDATKQAVLQRIHSVSLIHIATHGDAERGEIALAPPRPFNGTPQEDDYLLKMAEISQVRLRAKLVVLSCCHSARGKIRSEGVIGIARAFLGSGARSVLAALWAIEDKATEQFMSRFYEHLARGESASESLHQAMKWIRANGFPDVGQWAPFMLIGDDVTFDFGK